MYADPWGTDAIVITTATMSVVGNAHTSVIAQDSSGMWHYFYWGDENAVVKEVPASAMTDLDSFNFWLVENGAGKGGKNTDKPFHDSSDNYTTATYIEGDFSETVKFYYDQIENAGITRTDNNGKIVYDNPKYRLLSNNCFHVSYEGLKRGNLIDGTNFGDFAKFDGNGSIRPNDFRVMIRETFANLNFKKYHARVSVINNIGAPKPWYMSSNYYNRSQAYGKMLKGN